MAPVASFRVLAAAVAVTLVLTASAAPPVSRAGAQHGSDHAHPSTPASPYDAALLAAMADMHVAMAAAPMIGDPDRDFLTMMIPHHEGAVAMARLVLLHGRDPLVRQLAEGIIAVQQTEILSMQNRLRILHAGPEPDPGGFPALHGTRGPAPESRPAR